MPEIFELKVREIIPRTYNVKSVRLETPQKIEYQAGQFLCATLKSEPVCKRYLSISSSPTEKGYIEFTKKLTGSDFSQAIEKLKPRDTLSAQYPMGKFTLDGEARKIAFISGGIGITPIRSMCKYALDAKLGLDIVLIYANRSVNDIAFREDFELMQKQSSSLKVVHVLSEPSADFPSRQGWINGQLVKEEIPDYKERKFYLCGPPAMVGAMKKVTADELCLAEAAVVVENFAGY